ncbi:MAG: FAD-dependent oxidoreductase [Alphaproteobacteria bacterium]|nr:FAD-dependent oxidoreductase [Alphaproteobacteria bacterium]
MKIEHLNLYNTEYLQKLDAEFLLYLQNIDESLYKYLISQRQKYPNFAESYGNEDAELIECAKILEVFIADIFEITDCLEKLHQSFCNNLKAFDFKRTFVNKKVKAVDISQYSLEDFHNIKIELNLEEFNEDIFIEKINGWLQQEAKYSREIELASIFGAFLFFDRNLYEAHGCPVIFFKSQKRDFNSLVPVKRAVAAAGYTEVFKADSSKQIIRNDFNLYLQTDYKTSLHNSNYCVKCHKRGKDYCRTGEADEVFYSKNPLNKELTGCPLSMNISQMHSLNEAGNIIAALAVAAINNPLLAATGANICNDCTVACIFQKQEAVNTPCAETETLKQVLLLDYGFEIYSLLSRWNPLRFYRPYPLSLKHQNILVVGLGPAGFSLAYNMAQNGYGVVAVDALKLEPLADDFKPIIKYKEIVENLDDRIIQGFGGVAEYGITSRWDKNYLKVLRIILQRNSLIKMYGGIRFGANLDFKSAKKLGFSHIALCTGAGKPNIPELENAMVQGVKTSSEFLMNLNLGSYKKDSLFNMQIRLPLIVLGGGLTALDCATEAVVYYKRMVEKIAGMYKSLDKNLADIFLPNEDKELLQEYLAHYELFKTHDAIDAINKLGCVKIIYHKKFEESKAYKGNAEETYKALKQGVSFIEEAKLVKIHKNSQGLSSLDFIINGKIVNIPAKTLILAMGTNPNNILMEEYPNIFGAAGSALQTLNIGKAEFKKQKFSVILQKIAAANGDIAISILGDTHKTFNGSVVKAMASSFYGQYEIMDSMNGHNTKTEFKKIAENFESAMLSQITNITAVAENIYEISIKSPLLAEKFQAGQFFKIQNFESSAAIINGIKLSAEPVMLTGVSSDKINSIIKCIVLKCGVSTDILANLKVGGNILCMGPLGEPSKIPYGKKIMVVGGGVANATALAIAQQAKQQNCEVIYVGGYKKNEDIFYLDSIKKNSLQAFLSVENLKENFLDDNISYIKGNILSALDNAYNKDITNIFIAGSGSMMGAVKNYLQNVFSNREKTLNMLKDVSCETFYEYFLQTSDSINYPINQIQSVSSINSPMNCGLGGVCASCLSKKEDGSFFYACSKQELSTEEIDFLHLQQRLSQNSLMEKISYLFYKNLADY